MENQLIPIDPGKPFCFECSPENACFNACCRDLNQCLTPFDILMLKKYLHITSTRFLEMYTISGTGPETGFPVISLKPDYHDHLKCPFVTQDGCRVYPARPSSCRIYPLARGVTRSRQTKEQKEHWAPIKEAHCRGFDREKSQTVDQWVQDQDFLEYNEMNDMMVALIALKNQRGRTPLTIRENKMFHMALYDLDTFRFHVFEKNILDSWPGDRELMTSTKTSDKDLLKLGMAWITYEYSK